MMNIVALSLLVSSLAAAGVWSPPTDPNPVHRLIVVEYEREVPPPSSPSLPPSPTHPELAADDNDKPLDDAASVIPHPSKDNISSLITKTKHKAAQLEESGSEAVASVAANISVAAKKAVDRAEVTAEELRGNLTDILRRARDLGRDAAAHVGAGAARAARSAAGVSHLLGFGIAFGTCVWVTFLSSHVLASSLARQQFAVVQSRIYPVYFRAVGFGVAAAAAAVWSAGRGAAERTQGYNLLAVLATVMVNMLYLEPKATKAMFERMKLEKEDGRGIDVPYAGTGPAPAGTPPAPIGSVKKMKAVAVTEQDPAKSQMSPASSRLRRLNSYSSFLNVLCLMGLSWHLVHLARRLESSC